MRVIVDHGGSKSRHGRGGALFRHGWGATLRQGPGGGFGGFPPSEPASRAPASPAPASSLPSVADALASGGGAGWTSASAPESAGPVSTGIGIATSRHGCGSAQPAATPSPAMAD